MMDPKHLLLDFEQVLSDGFTDIFPDVIIARDRFHFVQANVKCLNELGGGLWQVQRHTLR
jgi:hypothetical protein